VLAVTEREQLLAEANKLQEEQRDGRGWTPIKVQMPNGGKIEGLKMGPYVRTTEGELRAAKIVSIRRHAARLETAGK
jgi:hypothetical protein